MLQAAMYLDTTLAVLPPVHYKAGIEFLRVRFAEVHTRRRPGAPAAPVAGDAAVAALLAAGVDPAAVLLEHDAGESSDEIFRKELVAMAKARQAYQHDPDASPIDFFLACPQASEFPTLKAIALDIFAAPAGEAPSERAFSIASRLIGTERVHLAPDFISHVTLFTKNRLVFGSTGSTG
jgi:hypothetical protein